jgi:hypothetical protein
VSRAQLTMRLLCAVFTMGVTTLHTHCPDCVADMTQVMSASGQSVGCLLSTM